MNVNEATPLHEAIRQGNPERIAVLIEEGCDVNEIVNNYTPLLRLVDSYQNTPDLRENYLTIAENLLKAKANPNLPVEYQDADQVFDIEDECGDECQQLFPLHMAVEYGHIELVDLFLRYQAEPHHYHKNETALIVAINKGHDDITRLLVPQVYINQPTQFQEITPWQLAIEKAFDEGNNVNHLRYLLRDPRLGITTEDLVEKILSQCIYQLIADHADSIMYSEAQSKVSKMVHIVVLGGYDLSETFSHYPQLLSDIPLFEGMRQMLEMGLLPDEEEDSSAEMATARRVCKVLGDEEALSHIMQKEILLFIQNTLAEAEQHKATEEAKLRNIFKSSDSVQYDLDPSHVKQYLLASSEEKEELIANIIPLVGVNSKIMYRFFRSLKQQQQECSSLKKAWDSRFQQTQEQFNGGSKTKKSLDIPFKVLQNMLENCLSGSLTASIFGVALKGMVPPAEEGNNLEAEALALDEEFNAVQDKVAAFSMR